MHQLSNWDLIKNMDALLPAPPRLPTVSLRSNTRRYLAEIEVEGKIHPRENLISLDFSELFVLHTGC